MARHLQVRLLGERAGRLTQTDSGRLAFEYEPSYIEDGGAALSLSLPLGPQRFGHREAEPFFGGLLPEEGARERIARYLGVSVRNDFALLAEIGGECAGAVELFPEEHPGEPQRRASHAGGRAPKVLSDDELFELLEELPRRPLLAGGEARLSLAGAQDKVAVLCLDGAIALPRGGEPTTHILKTPIRGYPETVANERFCMALASRVGLAVAPAQARSCQGSEYLLVERYDRRIDPVTGAVERIHQEDFCQALCVPTRMKYQSEGGPALKDLFALLTSHSSRPAVDRLALLRATLFNILIGNADAHGKNFSLLHGLTREPGIRPSVRLAPLYDLLCTLVYPDLSPRYAMKIGSKAEFKDIRDRHWDAFAESAGLGPPQVRRELRSMAERIDASLDASHGAALDVERASSKPSGIIDRIAEAARERCARVLTTR